MIISDLCDEYAVLVSQNKAPVYGYDNVNVPYGLVINDDGILVESGYLGTSVGRNQLTRFQYRLVLLKRQVLCQIFFAVMPNICSVIIPRNLSMQ